MKQKKKILKAFVSVMILMTMLISGAGTQKSYARPKNTYMYEANYNVCEFIKKVCDRVMKSIYRVQDAPYKAMIDYIYGQTENLQYEFVGDKVVKIVSNKGFLNRNYDSYTTYSDEEGGFYVRNELMEKVTHYYNDNGLGFSLYYRYANDVEPSYAVYRYESKKTGAGGFFKYNMRGEIEDAWLFKGVWAPKNNSAFYADSRRCKELVKFINKMMEALNAEDVGPSVIKVANNSSFLKRNYQHKVTYSTDEEWFVLGSERIDKEEKYYLGDCEYIAFYYINKDDAKPTYVGYRHQENGGNGSIIAATYDMSGKFVYYNVPFLVGDWYNNIDWED